MKTAIVSEIRRCRMLLRQHARLLVVAGTILAGLAPIGATGLAPISPWQLGQPAERILESVVTAVTDRLPDRATSDPVTLPPTLGTFAIGQCFKADAADGCSLTRRFREGPDGRGKVRLIPEWPTCDVCASGDIILGPDGDPLIWNLIIEYPLAVC
jgi:hypothetical protein